MYVLRKVLA